MLCVGLLSLAEVVADMDFACGRYGKGSGRCGLWPISSVADMVVADMVCGRYRRNSFLLSPQSSFQASCADQTELGIEDHVGRLEWTIIEDRYDQKRHRTPGRLERSRNYNATMSIYNCTIINVQFFVSLYFYTVYTLCLKKGTPTLSIVTLDRINGF